MKKYAIIGASGLIGSHLTKSLLDDSSEIFALSRTPLNFKHPNLRWMQCDLQNNSLVDYIPSNVDAIIYLAQSEYFKDFPEKVMDIFNINIKCYLETLNFAASNSINHVIYASSGGVYQQNSKQFDEEDGIAPSNELGFYLGTKICSEILSHPFKNILNLQILRFFFVYGNGQQENMLIPRLIKNIREGNPISLDGKNGVNMNPIYVLDAVSAIKMILKTKNSQIYNVGGDSTYSLREICNIIGDILQKDPLFINNTNSEKMICGNIKKIKDLGWSPKFSLSEGLQSMILGK